MPRKKNKAQKLKKAKIISLNKNNKSNDKKI